jgi:hypothetical protein
MEGKPLMKTQPEILRLANGKAVIVTARWWDKFLGKLIASQKA